MKFIKLTKYLSSKLTKNQKKVNIYKINWFKESKALIKKKCITYQIINTLFGFFNDIV